MENRTGDLATITFGEDLLKKQILTANNSRRVRFRHLPIHRLRQPIGRKDRLQVAGRAMNVVEISVTIP
jgi:hypothetical protein